MLFVVQGTTHKLKFTYTKFVFQKAWKSNLFVHFDSADQRVDCIVLQQEWNGVGVQCEITKSSKRIVQNLQIACGGYVCQ